MNVETLYRNYYSQSKVYIHVSGLGSEGHVQGQETLKN